MPSELILQFMDPNGRFDCEKYINIPTPRSSYIAIAYTSSPQAQQQALDLKHALVSQLQGLNVGVHNHQPPRCGGGLVPLGQCYAIDDNAFNNRMLIIVGDGATLPTFAIPKALEDHIVPVLHVNVPFNFNAPVSAANCLRWQYNIAETSVFILNRMGIGAEQQRIFVSYRQQDTSPLADQLFDALHHNGFEVFVDRFSIEPGVNFQTRLYQELRDKAMVLFIESPHYLESKWVQLEIAFAKKYRLAYHALNFKGAPVIDSVHDSNRTKLVDAHFGANGTELNQEDMNNLIIKIKDLHTRAMFRRRHYMNLNLFVAFKYLASGNTIYQNDLVKVERNNQHYEVFSLLRPPQATDYYFVDNFTHNHKIIFGPEYVESNRRAVNSWLADKVRVNYFDEGELIKLALDIRDNNIIY